jgi:VPDSG-CTERM motif
MKKLLITVALGLGLVMTATTAHAAIITLAFGDANFLGTVNPGTPADETNTLNYINSLILLAPGATAVDCQLDASEDCDRVGSTLAGPFPMAVAEVGKVDLEVGDAPSLVADAAFSYVVGKYDAQNAGTWVWFVSGVKDDTVVLPANFTSGHGLSHIGLYNGGVSVPDGGATLGLLGLAMLGVGYLRRRIS